MHAAMRGADARNQLANAEGLGHIVVGAQLQRLHLVLFAVAHRHHQHRQARRRAANAAQRLNAANARHVDVQQHHIHGIRVQQLQRFLAARGLDDLKTKLAQRRPQRAADGGFVVHNHHSNRVLAHRVFLLISGAGIAA